MATPLNTFQISSPSNLTSIPLVAGSDMEKLGFARSYTLATCFSVSVIVAYYVKWPFGAPAQLQTFWGRMVGSMMEFAIKLILNAQPVLVLSAQGRRAGYQAIFCHIANTNNICDDLAKHPEKSPK
ncbi:hypothetical protein C8R45DRAFT_926678 [Mycena sanguinolenta]|nr:hypothetical protein C8R45DRAFT_926678 [Mycena sanguinolenta]